MNKAADFLSIQSSLGTHCKTAITSQEFDEGSLFHMFFKFCLLFMSYVLVVSHCYFKKFLIWGSQTMGSLSLP